MSTRISFCSRRRRAAPPLAFRTRPRQVPPRVRRGPAEPGAGTTLRSAPRPDRLPSRIQIYATGSTGKWRKKRLSINGAAVLLGQIMRRTAGDNGQAFDVSQSRESPRASDSLRRIIGAGKEVARPANTAWALIGANQPSARRITVEASAIDGSFGADRQSASMADRWLRAARRGTTTTSGRTRSCTAKTSRISLLAISLTARPAL